MKKGSYTVEMAILIPFLILIMAFAIHMAVDLYSEIKNEDMKTELKNDWAVDDFYIRQGVKELVNDGS